MLKKIVSIKNVGRFRNSAAAGNPQLAKHTFIVGANGFGKTTICAVLRSLHTGDPSHVLGRTTLGVADAAAVDLLLDTCLARFDGAAWTTTHPVAVFDSVFVAENVHSGDAVEIDHKRNLYRVIIGDDGVQLAEEDARLAGESRAKTSEMSAAAKARQPHVPAGMQLDSTVRALAGAGGTAVDRNLSEKMRAQSIEIEKLVRRRHRLTQSRPVRSHDQQAAPFGDFDLARVFLIGRLLSHTAVTPSVPARRWFHACIAPPQAPDSRIPSRAPRPRQAGHTGR